MRRLAALALAGLVIGRPAASQDTLRTRADTLKADSLRADSLRRVQRQRADSIEKVRLDSLRSDSLMREDLAIIAEQQRRADSIKAPLVAAEMPVLTEHAGVLRWDRDQLGATGALTLGDLLESVPGVTVFRTGWIGSPEQAAFLGDFSNVRVFLDGVEMDALDRRNGGILDLSFVQIWQLEEVRIERGAFEVRIYLQSWRVRSVTPSTRVDIGSGDLSTNAYRGFFGRRFGSGQSLQVGAFQYSTREPREIGDADQLSLFTRLGWARRGWSVDGTMLRTRRERTLQPRDEDVGADLTPIDATNLDVMGRIGYADSARGWWLQLTAARTSHRQSALLSTSDGGLTGGSSGADTSVTDSTAFDNHRRQYVAAAGWSRGPWTLSATLRLRDSTGGSSLSPMLRGAWQQSRLTLSGTAEKRQELAGGALRLEGAGRLQLLSFLAVSGAVSRTTFDDTTITGSPMAYRGEGSLRFRNLWLGGGAIYRDPARLIAPIIFDTTFRGIADPSTTGLFLTARGKFWKDVGMDISAIKWDAQRGFRPVYQARSQLYIDTSWPSRFPSGNLNIRFAINHEYRTRVVFPRSDANGDEGESVSSSQYRTWGLQLEIRLIQATLTYQFRNVLNEVYSQVPGFTAVRPVQVYGVRWNFFN